jgi:predicted site-specific integrase-resolvase
MAKSNKWIEEQQAAQRLGYQPETLRRYCKGGKLSVSFTHVNNRKFKYSEQDIERVLNQNATIIYEQKKPAHRECNGQ